jgi:hypothetical protein
MVWVPSSLTPNFFVNRVFLTNTFIFVKRNSRNWSNCPMKSRVLPIVLTLVLVASICLNIFLYFQELKLNQENDDFSLYYREFKKVPVQDVNYSFSPPVSMYRALRIALISGGWNTTSLKGLTVHIVLDYISFTRNSTEIGGTRLNLVTYPVTDYSPSYVNENTTLRYVWIIDVNNSTMPQIHPPGYYMVDAATAEIVFTLSPW